MDFVLSGLCYVICLCYLDDVIVFGRDFEEHCTRLKTVLERLRLHGLRVKPEKCTIAARQVSFSLTLVSCQIQQKFKLSTTFLAHAIPTMYEVF